MENDGIETIELPNNNDKGMLINLFNKHMTTIIIAIIIIIVLIVGGIITIMFINSKKKNKTTKKNDKRHQEIDESLDNLHHELETGEADAEYRDDRDDREGGGNMQPSTLDEMEDDSDLM